MSKVVLVTGGSRGIGAAVCRLAAKAGYDVAVNYAGREDAARAVAAEVKALGRRAVILQADVGNADAIPDLFDRCIEEFGGLDAVVNNAGVINKTAPLADLSVEEIRRIVDIDLTSAMLVAREAVRRMSTARGGKGGVLVNMSSRASELAGVGGFIPYGAAKGGIDVLTIGLGREVAGEGIRVCGIRPGLIDTDIQNDTGVEQRMERFGPTVPMGRGGTADEVAETVLWLMSEKASYVTATTIDVSGGR
ncbi:SDR family oxidoreductase [Marinivivus vitaminiproducens]|uniref:SDR family oxidoreductase n=1 Tax=Marinivivus vitaminiproducens TaxID=3035935 RepID=UPI0027995071|nr:SDR family oxidoreductase [Geminicoccaceae bacterium SCSIO 64248]